jgi:hypothetical protein
MVATGIDWAESTHATAQTIWNLLPQSHLIDDSYYQGFAADLGPASRASVGEVPERSIGVERQPPTVRRTPQQWVG